MSRSWIQWFSVTSASVKARVAYLQQRRSIYITNDQFVAQLFTQCSDSERTIATVLRSFVAQSCKIAPEKLDPKGRISDIIPLLDDTTPDVHRILDVEYLLELLTGYPLALEPERLPCVVHFPHLSHEVTQDDYTIGDWILAATRQVVCEIRIQRYPL